MEFIEMVTTIFLVIFVLDIGRRIDGVITKLMTMHNDTKLELQKNEIASREKMLRDSLSYRKYHDTRLMEHREMVSNSKAESYVQLLSIALNEFGDMYLNVRRAATMPLEDHMNTLDKLIDREMQHHIVLPRVGRENKPPITDYKQTTEIVAGKILSATTPEFFEIFEIHGLSRSYVMSYITRQLFVKLVMYSEEIRKKKED